MAVPDFQTLMLPVLKLAAEGEISMSACILRMAQFFQLTQDQRAEKTEGGQNRFRNRVHWAKTYLFQAGLVESPRRGHIRITDAGRQVLASGIDRIDSRYLERFPSYIDFQNRTRAEPSVRSEPTSAPTSQLEPQVGSTPEERIDGAALEIDAELRTQLLQRIVNSQPSFFESLIVDLLLAMGYGGSRAEAGRQIGGTGDGGVDGVIDQDALGLDMVYLQAKRYKPDNTIGEGQIREFSGALLGKGASKGVFVTTSGFSDAARRFADAMRQQRLVLIDGDKLTRLMIKHGVGVRTERTIELKKIDLDYFEEEE